RSITGLTRTVQSLRPVLQPFVGRTKEFGELQHRLNAAMAGECQFAVVSGEPGIGKTRLLDELESLANARKVPVLHGRTVAQDRSFPYPGFCDLIQESFRLKDHGGAPPPDLADLAPDLVSLFPMLNEISGLRQVAGDAKPQPAPAVPEDRTQVFELLARALTRIAAGKPLVLMLEDLHGADLSIEALQYIVRPPPPRPSSSARPAPRRSTSATPWPAPSPASAAPGASRPSSSGPSRPPTPAPPSRRWSGARSSRTPSSTASSTSRRAIPSSRRS